MFTVRNEVAKVMFLEVSVCPLGGGVVVSQHALHVVSQHALQQVPRGHVLSQHALQVVSQHALQQVFRGCLLPGGVPAVGGGLLLGCLVPGGLLPGGGCGDPSHPTPQKSRWLLLRTVRILLECILVRNSQTSEELCDIACLHRAQTLLLKSDRRMQYELR